MTQRTKDIGINMTTAINTILRQYEEYVVSSLKEADMKVAEGSMKYYTVDEIRSKLEDVLNEKV